MTGKRTYPRLAAGFTLIELLIAMVIVLIVTGGALTAFSYAVRASNTIQQKLEMNDQIRIALDLMVRDFIQVAQGLPDSKVIALPAGGAITQVKRPSPPGKNYLLANGATELNSITSGYELGPTVGAMKTDIVTMIYADNLPCIAPGCTDPFMPITGTVTNGGANVVIDAARPIFNLPDGIHSGDLLMFVNGSASALQMVTAEPTSQTLTFGTSDGMNVNQRTATTGTITTIGSTTPVVSRIRMVSYYIDATTDPGMPRLIRQINFNTGRVVAFGIENIKFTYDIADGLNNPTGQTTPATPNQIRKINIALQARSRLKSKQTNDYFRGSLATQVSLRSMALVDRYK